MYQACTEQYRKTVAAVVAAARQRKSGRGMDTKRFLQAYYANVDANDMATRAPAMLAATALSHLSSRSAARGRALVRVFNPTLQEHGYTSPHTVIEMVNDDMPFLVDSIGLALDRSASLTLHFLAHPIFAVARDAAGGVAHACRGAARPSRGAGTAARVVPAHRDRPHRRSRGARVAVRRRSSAACATCASPAPIGRKCAQRRARTRRRIERRCSARLDARDVSEAAGAARLDGGPPLHFPRAIGNIGCAAARAAMRCERWRRPGLGSCARGHKRPPSTSRIARERHPPPEPLARLGAGHEGEPAIHGASRRLSRLRRRQAIRSRRPADRRAAISGPVDLRRPTTPIRARFRCVRHKVAQVVRAFRARARQPRRQGAAAHPGIVSARRAVPGERGRTHPASSRASSGCRSGRACVCCCAAILSGASIPAWCSCRARNTTPRCASASSGSSATRSRRSAWNRRCRSPNRTWRASTSLRAPCRARRRASTPMRSSGESPLAVRSWAG